MRSAAQVLGADVDDPIAHLRRDQPPRATRAHRPRHQTRGRQGVDRAGGRAVQPVSSRGRSGATRSLRPGCRSRSAASMSPAASRCCRRCRRRCARRRHSASRFFAGEAEEGRLDAVLRDAWAGKLAAALQFHGRSAVAAGRADRRYCRASMSAARPAPCRASTWAAAALINARSAPSSTCRDARAASVRRMTWNGSSARTIAQGIRRFFITDDNFARNRHWEPLFDRHDRAAASEGLNIGFTIQVDTLCHRIPNFIEKAGRAGVRARVHRAGEHQSGEPAGRQETAEPHHRVSHDAAGMARGWCHHLCRLHHRLPGRHEGVDPSRHRDHQAGTAARYPGILRSDAAAGFRGSQARCGDAESGWTPT